MNHTCANCRPQYDDLASTLESAAQHIDILSKTLAQLDALFVLISRGQPRTQELAELGAYVASDWANSADCAREEYERVAKEARGVTA